jgi:hypothetical protein
MSGPILFTLTLEPPPVVLDLFGPNDELLQYGYDGGDSRVVAIVGPPGLSAPDAPPLLHTQASAAAEWIVNHDRGFRPLVTVLGAGGGEVVAEVLHISDNQLRIYFSQPQAGSALVR